MSEDHTRHMRQALTLGRRGLGRVAPWPSVGCVLVNGGRIVGRGTSDAVTLRHAERVALDQAGDAARGATAYVTLEPCSHHGRTPPCADGLAAAGITRVVIAADDPNPQVAGQGIARLRAAGIEVLTGVLEKEATEQHLGFFRVMTDGRPMLTLKLASTLDGRIATASGESRWITGPDARRAVHALRMSHDAVLVGGGTARADDPTLTVRDIGADRQPVRIVASHALDLPFPSRLSASASEGPVWLIHGEGQATSPSLAAWTGAGVRCLGVPSSHDRLDIPAMMQRLAAEGMTRVFCEGGGSLAASLLDAGMVDRLILMTAGKLIGSKGRPSVGPLDLASLTDAPTFQLRDVRALGGDVMQTWARA